MLYANYSLCYSINHLLSVHNFIPENLVTIKNKKYDSHETNMMENNYLALFVCNWRYIKAGESVNIDRGNGFHFHLDSKHRRDKRSMHDVNVNP